MDTTEIITKLIAGSISPAEARDLIESRIADLKADRFTYCAYCGEEFTIDAGGTPEAVSEHIHNCPKHPIQDYKTEMERLELRLVECVTPDEAREAIAEAGKESFDEGYKLGIKEVVDYIGDYTKPFPNQKDWKLKLKEWGLALTQEGGTR